jgi:kinesin family protein 6/9
VDKNKEQLREKIAEAKAVGERANQSRNTITYLKNSIEAIRRERALQQLTSSGGGADALSSKNAAGDDEGGSVNGSGTTTESPEESTYRRAIEQEKVVYKESFERLRVLKPEIEYIRKNLEKCRNTMQTQFDQWYTNLHSRSDMIANVHTSAYSSSDGNNNRPTPQQQNRDGVATGLSRAAESKKGPLTTAAVVDSPEDDVDEDIMAFYQAKEEMLKRRGAAN